MFNQTPIVKANDRPLAVVDWDGLEQMCQEHRRSLPDGVPQNARDWRGFKEQYEMLESFEDYTSDEFTSWRDKICDNYKTSIIECCSSLNSGWAAKFKEYGLPVDWLQVLSHSLFGSIALPLVRQMAAQTIGMDIVSVQPLSAPQGLLHYMNFSYDMVANPATHNATIQEHRTFGHRYEATWDTEENTEEPSED